MTHFEQKVHFLQLKILFSSSPLIGRKPWSGSYDGKNFVVYFNKAKNKTEKMPGMEHLKKRVP